MALITGKEATYETANQFRSRCLMQGRSLIWPTAQAWNQKNITQLWDAFMGNPDEGEGSFLSKWHKQLANAPADVHRVAADVLAFYYLFPANTQINSKKKKSRLHELISWKLADSPGELEAINAAYDVGGIGSAGTFYQMHPPWQVAYLLKFAQRSLDEHTDVTAIAPCKSLADRVQKEVQGSAGARNILLHLLFPADFERIASDGDKSKIVKAFESSVPNLPSDTDDALAAIRQVLLRDSGKAQLDFYEPELYNRWNRSLYRPAKPGKTGKVSEEGVTPSTAKAFTRQTFELLKRLAEQPTQEFYSAHRQEFKELVEEPFQDLFKSVIARLRPEPKGVLETESRLFSRIPKNDYGRGGAWPYYWAALYPKGGKRTEDSQLYMFIDGDALRFGFTFGEYASDQQRRFLRNYRDHRRLIAPLIKEFLENQGLRFGPSDGPEVSIDHWLDDPEEAGIGITKTLTAEAVLAESRPGLVDQVVAIFELCFPLVLLATQDLPLPAIRRYMAIEEEPDTRNPEYSLETMAADTLLPVDVLRQWVNAIERKGQVIIYGPPGTGKTFVAEHLAKHLVGESDGLIRLVQFHPAYAYEDFIQGIRPQAQKDGGLSYPLMPGRFLEFCAEAGTRQGRSVLIVDEINRANLARVFGELMYLLEYRNRQVPLATGGVLQIPDTVRLIGTMNTADRSVALVDHALRRRFAFLRLQPNYEVLRKFHQQSGFDTEPLIQELEHLNSQIGDPHYFIGISFFLRNDLADCLEDIWRTEIQPYIEEFFFDRPEKVDSFTWESIRDRTLPS